MSLLKAGDGCDRLQRSLVQPDGHSLPIGNKAKRFPACSSLEWAQDGAISPLSTKS